MKHRPEVAAHGAVIDRCNQRGGCMLSLVDLLDAGTLTRELAAYFLAAIGGGASFMIGALPGGAGKTTVMGALLNLVPPAVPLAVADGLDAIEQGLRGGPRRCFICHEIGPGSYYAYLWGEPLRRYFELPSAGHMLATNLHADTFEQARRQVCDENGVSPDRFRRMNVIAFLSVVHGPEGTTRRVTSVWESDGTGEHRQIYDGTAPRPPHEASRLVPAGAFQAAAGRLDRLLASGARQIDDVRAFLTTDP